MIKNIDVSVSSSTGQPEIEQHNMPVKVDEKNLRTYFIISILVPG